MERSLSAENARLRALLADLLSQLRPLARMAEKGKEDARHRFDQVRDYLRDNLAEPIRLEELATVASLSTCLPRALPRHTASDADGVSTL